MDPRDLKDQTVIQDMHDKLAVGLYNVTIFWAPDCIVLGGGFMNNPWWDFVKVKKLVSKQSTVSHAPPITLAGLSESVLSGATLL